MALGSKRTVVLADSPSLAKPGLSLSSFSPVLPSTPAVSFSASTLSHSPSSTSIYLRKLFPNNIDNENWVDAMKASKAREDITLASRFNHAEPGLDMADAAYDSWMVDHPSALSMFEQMMSTAKGKHIAVFLDYDGTLSPIVEDPERAYMSDTMRSAVQEVARYFPTAIISGRCRDKVYDFVQVADIYYAGSHGMDIMAPARAFNGSKKGYKKTRDKMGTEVLFQPAKEFLPMIDEVFKLLKEKLKRIPGAMVENNKFCASVHFRCVEDKNLGLLVEKVKSVLKDYPLLHITDGKKVLEIRPSIEWHKGNALEYLLDSLGLANSKDVMPLYIGDDQTDEDAFRVLKARGQGYSILVSSVAKETLASYSLRDPSEVMAFLHHLVEWKKNTFNSR